MNLENLTGFQLPHTTAGHPTQRMLAAALKKVTPRLSPHPKELFWDQTFFGLDRVSCFQAATLGQQTQILQIANRDVLEEIYWVEQAGVGYMAKMLMLAETCEERLLYSLFAADEATHLTLIRPFLEEDPVFNDDTFLAFMGQLIESSDKTLLMALVQVVLEGWGLTYYRSLVKTCLDPQLADTLRGFFEAESRHHALGVIQVQTCLDPSSQSLEAIHTALTHFLHIVQLGPQRLLQAIAIGLGDLTKQDKAKILTELQYEVQTYNNLQLLRSLMTNVIPNPLLQSLEDQGSFQPYPITQCV